MGYNRCFYPLSTERGLKCISVTCHLNQVGCSPRGSKNQTKRSIYRLVGAFLIPKIKLEEIQKDSSINSFGAPNALKKEIALTAEICDYMREQVDAVFGEGTSRTVFGDMNVPAMFGEFFNEIAPHITAARNKATKKYTGKKDDAGQ